MATYNIAVKTVEGSHIAIPSNVIIPTRYNDGNVIAIANEAFKNCTDLISITLPQNTIRIGTSAFEGCTGLTAITIPENVIAIEARAFEGCTGLATITIPANVTYMGEDVFAGWSALQTINVNATKGSVNWPAGWNGDATVEFLPDPVYNITVSQKGSGTVDVAESAKQGEEVTITLNPSNGYSIGSVMVDGTVLEVVNKQCTFEMPNHDVTISVTFEKISRKIFITAPNNEGDAMEEQTISYNETKQGYYFNMGSKVSSISSTILSNERLIIEYYDTNTQEWYEDKLAGGWIESTLTTGSYLYQYTEEADSDVEGPIQLRARTVN